MSTHFSSIAELRATRRSYIESARSNNFQDGLRALLADLYPDNAHFIYELLQNAEDAKATYVNFDLRSDGLNVVHNGARPFELADVESITGIGQSTKKDDETQIGKFGVGFKAVFAYTNRPEIRSGGFAFAIEDLFVPELIAEQKSDGLTTFSFPFDRVEKSQAQAFAEIQRGLLDLDESTVLFLNRVARVSFTIDDGPSGQVVRHDDVNRRLRISSTLDGQTTDSFWLRLVGTVGAKKGLPADSAVAAAFNLAPPAGRGKKLPKLRIEALDVGRTCIYFPAAKETSGLRFHIHAPFASTVARDSVRDTPENAELLLSIADLIARELILFRDAGLIDNGFLAALPNPDDALSPNYAAIRDRIQQEFRVSEVTPVYGGGFARADSLFWSPPELSRFLEHDDLPVLMSLIVDHGEGEPQWISHRDGRAGRFLRGLGVADFGWDELGKILKSVAGVSWAGEEVGGHEQRPVRWVEWLASKSEEKLVAFYELIGFGVQEDLLIRSYLDFYRNYLERIPILRLPAASGGIRRGPGNYLPESRNDHTPARVPAALAFFPDDEPSPRKSHLEAFYRAIGVQRWDVRAQIDQRLKRYRDEDWPEDDEHLDDIRAFILFLGEHPAEVSRFSRANFLQITNLASGENRWESPATAFLDEPYAESGLQALHVKLGKNHDGNHRHRVAAMYIGLGESFPAFAKAVGCQAKLLIESSRVWENPEYRHGWASGRTSGYTIRLDWDVPLFDEAVETGDYALLRALWKLACETPASFSEAKFRINGSSTMHTFRSRIAQRMAVAAWLPDGAGNLRTPATMTVSDLQAGWTAPPSDSLASGIGFASDAAARQEGQVLRQQEADHLEIPLKFVDGYNSLNLSGQAQVMELVESLKQADSFPSSASSDPIHRAAVVGSDAKLAPERETELRERQVRVGNEVRDAARAYLRELYTDDEGNMWCQSCQCRMPFKVKSKWFFVAMQCVRGRRYEHPQNSLALCPLCAARYQHVRDTTDDTLLAAIEDLQVEAAQGVVMLAVSMDGKRVQLQLAGKHAIDLKATLAVAGDSRGRD